MPGSALPIITAEGSAPRRFRTAHGADRTEPAAERGSDEIPGNPPLGVRLRADCAALVAADGSDVVLEIERGTIQPARDPPVTRRKRRALALRYHELEPFRGAVGARPRGRQVQRVTPGRGEGGRW